MNESPNQPLIPTPETRLKAERVQLRVEPEATDVPADRLRQRLEEESPVWQVDARGRAIAWMRRFPHAGLAAAYASYLAQLAVRAGHPLEIALANERVLVTLRGRLVQGRRSNLTEEALEFARAFA